MLANKLMSSLSGGAEETFYVDDVFSVYTRTGTGTDVTVPTGIDMTKGYMLWSKGRSGATDHAIYDSARGVTYDLASNLTAAQTIQATGLKAVSTSGHTVGSLAKMNTNAASYVDFVFRKSPKFFDVVTWTGNGNAGRQIPHSLGVVPGMIVVKRLDATGSWPVYHRSFGASQYVSLNLTTGAAATSARWSDTVPTASDFTVGTDNNVNAPGGNYVAYLFAHDPSADGIIQCGLHDSSAANTSTPAHTNLGWEPQYILMRNLDQHSDWYIIDSVRGIVSGDYSQVSAECKCIHANTSSAEAIGGVAMGISSTGFYTHFSGRWIYMAIRRSNKPPTNGTEVFTPITRTGSMAGTISSPLLLPTSILTDLVVERARATSQIVWFDRMRGGRGITSSGVPAEGGQIATFDRMTGSAIVSAHSTTNTSRIYWNFRRAPGFFDVVCYTGTGVARTVPHSLGVAPELMLVKNRTAAEHWATYNKTSGATKWQILNATSPGMELSNIWNNTEPSSSVFTIGTNVYVNTPPNTYVAYLFASLPGISKVGSYTGNGTTQTIPCGFTTGARFILIKRTDAAGDWYLWDTARGIVADNDPYLSLNTTAAEVTSDDSVDPHASGFIVNQVATTNINVSGGQYIFLAIA